MKPKIRNNCEMETELSLLSPPATPPLESNKVSKKEKHQKLQQLQITILRIASKITKFKYT